LWPLTSAKEKEAEKLPRDSQLERGVLTQGKKTPEVKKGVDTLTHD
jgi:hypothetical protein